MSSGDDKSKRYPRRLKTAAEGAYAGQDEEHDESAGEDGAPSSDGDPNDSDELGESEADFERIQKGRKRRSNDSEEAAGRRTSKRANKFASSMAEPQGISDLLAPKDVNKTSPRKRRGTEKKTAASNNVQETETEDDQPSKKRRGKDRRDSLTALSKEENNKDEDEDEGENESEDKKRPVRRNNKTRRSKATSEQDSEDSWEREEEYEEEAEDEEPLKMQRILGCKSERRKTWNDICRKMNTSEVEFGSMWFQKSKENEEDFEERYLVKWHGLSYIHCSWENTGDLEEQVENAKTYIKTFFRKAKDGFLFTPEERSDGEYFDPAFTQVDRILEVSWPEGQKETKLEDEDELGTDAFGMVLQKDDPGFEDGVGRMFLIKWGNLPYCEATYEYERDLIIAEIEYKKPLKDFFGRNQKPRKQELKSKMKEAETLKRQLYQNTFGETVKLDDDERTAKVEEYQKDLRDKVFKNGGQLRDYQAEGVSWMISNYLNQRSCVLADEMGLGKTLQTAATLNLIATTLKPDASFLIIAPLSTIPHWLREFQAWTDLNAIVYHGGAEDRSTLRQYEFAYEEDRPRNGAIPNRPYLRKCGKNRKSKNSDSPWMVQVVIATPEMLVTDDAFDLAAIHWEVLVVDEAHRLKNHNSKLGSNLRDNRFKFNYKVLCTGTPIQNDMKELWTLLYFIDPASFGDQEEFLEKYGEMKSKESVDDLHETLRPYILRRLKEDVEKSMPPKEETIIEVELTLSQKQYYRALYEKNVRFLHKNKSKALDGPSLNNLAMQLRKCCNHACLLNGIEEELRKQNPGLSEPDFLVKGSGKFVLLDKLLPRLKEEGHRVLIFSQFKIMLDILEDYLDGRNMSFGRIDGSITGLKRQLAIDRFQSKEDSAPFIMMLSTRAGGVGINLTAADTVIIFDSDWNPQNDLQAQARCHRIGQKKAVKIYRLLSANTYEMQMFNLSSMKMGLDQAVLKGFESGSSEGALSKAEVEKLLRHGAYAILNEEKEGNAESASNEFGSQSIEDILARRARTIVHEGTGSGGSNAGGTFSKASFKVAKSPDSKKEGSSDVDLDDPDFWKKMLGDAYKEEENTVLDPKKRRKKQQNYSEDDKQYFEKISAEVAEAEASDYSYESDDDEDDELDDSGEPRKDGQSPSKPKERSRWGGSKPTQWSKEEVEHLEQFLYSFGYSNLSWETTLNLLSLTSKGTKETKRMTFSLILSMVLEAARNDAAAFEKRAKKSAEKQQENMLPNNTGDGGVLAEEAKTVAPVEIPSKTKILEDSFKKIWLLNTNWLSHVVKDGLDFAKEAVPRDPLIVAKELNPDLDLDEGEKDINQEFMKNLWTALKRRGWTAGVVSEGPLMGQSVFNYRGETLATISDAVRRAQVQHPELSTAVDSIISLMDTHTRRSEAFRANMRELHLSLTIENATFDLIDDFLNCYAPLQLLVNKKQLSLSRRVLTSCPLMTNAFALMRKANVTACTPESMARLSRYLGIDKRKMIPHAEWTNHQDAVLLYAVFLNGYIEHEKNYRGILSDKRLSWGAPFEKLPPRSQDQIAVDKVKWRELVDVGKRAEVFLNMSASMAGSSQPYRGVIADDLCIEQKKTVGSSSTDQPASVPTWKLNVQKLESRYERHFKNVAFELPQKKELARRTKALLSSVMQMPSDEKKNNADDLKQYNMAQLDQSDLSNKLLVELLRGLLRVSFANKDGKEVIQMLISKVLEEAQIRIGEELKLLEDLNLGDTESKRKVENAERVLKQLRFVNCSLDQPPRLYKNVIRVTLSETPLPGKAEEPLFPQETRPIVHKRNVLNAADRTLASFGRQAITEALHRQVKKESHSVTNSPAVLLTEVETIILSTACSFGIPDWREKYEHQSSVDFAWKGFGLQVEKTASLALERARALHRDAHNRERTTESNSEAQATLSSAEKSLERVTQAFDQAKDYSAEPETLAKKTVMMMAKLIMKIGLLSNGVRPDVGLGNKVLKWCSNHISSWARTLQLSDSGNEPLALTAVDFLADLPASERSGITVVACFDKIGCRHVFTQIASLSRLRSVLAGCNGDTIHAHVEQSLLNAGGNLDESWEDLKPAAWKNIVDDSLLLKRLLTVGYHDLLEDDQHMGFESEIASKSFKELNLSERLLQTRVNDIVRELHLIGYRSPGRSVNSAIIIDTGVARRPQQNCGSEGPTQSRSWSNGGNRSQPIEIDAGKSNPKIRFV